MSFHKQELRRKFFKSSFFQILDLTPKGQMLQIGFLRFWISLYGVNNFCDFLKLFWRHKKRINFARLWFLFSSNLEKKNYATLSSYLWSSGNMGRETYIWRKIWQRCQCKGIIARWKSDRGLEKGPWWPWATPPIIGLVAAFDVIGVDTYGGLQGEGEFWGGTVL
jgi:hypothetical protein